MLKKNDEWELEITGLTAEGSGVGKKDGMAVFVENTAPGDRILCHVILAKKSYAVGKALKILRSAEDRIPPDCAVSLPCGGCAFRHISYEAECRYKEQKVRDAFARIAHLTPVIRPICPSETISRYRNKAEYPITQENGHLQVGFYAKKSHRVIECEDCLLQPEEFSEIRNIFIRWAQQYHCSVYNEQLGKGKLRHLYLRKAFATNEIMVCLVINGTSLEHTDSLLAALKQVNGFTTLVLNTNTARTNVILGKQCTVLSGDGYITDVLQGVRVKLSPLSFYQVNRRGAELLYSKAKELAALTGRETVLDLYCGTGTIGLSMARDAERVIGVEVVPEAIEDARENARRNGIDNIEFLCMDASLAAEELLTRGTRPEVIVLDPPRKGCAEALLSTVNALSPERIVYVSCDPATLARDCARFAALGYTVREAVPVDLFPRTVHVETVALLVRD